MSKVRVPKVGVARPILLNDVHARLNPTRVAELVLPRSLAETTAAVRRAAAQAGMQWPGLLAALRGRQDSGLRRVERTQESGVGPLTFRQKQTGADRLSIGGALAANIHGRGLRFKPFVEDVESFTLIDAEGRLLRCGRSENAELFRLAIGGYGLFGIVAEVTLRLVPRTKLRRLVDITTLDDVEATFDRRLAEGFQYGDFQFAIDPTGSDFLSRGVRSAYLPVADDVPVTASPAELGAEQWQRLLALAHTDKVRAFDVYAAHYRATHGQVYWSDLHQLGVYVDGYHDRLDRSASEMITEVYLPRAGLIDFMAACRDDFRTHDVELIYGTVRVTKRDDETFLPWAAGDRACIVFNLHIRHTAAGIAKAKRDFRRIIDRALERGGSFYLAYHRWATPDQLLAGHPKFIEFLRAKLTVDPAERFQSQWYRHWRDLLHPRL